MRTFCSGEFHSLFSFFSFFLSATHTAEITPEPATVQIIRDRNQDIKSMIVQCDAHLKYNSALVATGKRQGDVIALFRLRDGDILQVETFQSRDACPSAFEDLIPQGR